MGFKSYVELGNAAWIDQFFFGILLYFMELRCKLVFYVHFGERFPKMLGFWWDRTDRGMWDTFTHILQAWQEDPSQRSSYSDSTIAEKIALSFDASMRQVKSEWSWIRSLMGAIWTMCSMEDVRVSCTYAKMYILYVRIHIRSLYKIVNSVTVHNSVNYSGLIPVQNLPSKALTCRMKTLQILKQ